MPAARAPPRTLRPGSRRACAAAASLVVGLAAAHAARADLLAGGVAGLVAGAMSMAAGKDASVSSQSDTKIADLARERAELAADWDQEHEELAPSPSVPPCRW